MNLRRSEHLDESPHGRRKLPSALVNDRERPREGALGELQHLERSSAGFVLDRRERYDRHTLSYFDRAFDGLDVVEFHRVQRLNAMFAQYAVGRLTRRDVAFVADEFLPRQ